MENRTVEAWNHQAELNYQQGKLQEAIAVCHHALKLNPNFAPTYKTLGNIFQASGKPDAALRAYEMAIAIDPNFPQAHANLGSMHYQQGNLDRAIECYETALKLDPNLAGVYWNLGNVCKHKGELNDAIAYRQKALNLQPNLTDASGYFHLGTDLLQQEKLEEAKFYLQQALQRDPNSAETYVHLGIVYRQQGLMQSAIEHYETAIQLQPDLVEAHWNLYELLITSRNFAAARQAGDRYINLAPGENNIMTAIAWISAYLKSGSFRQAQQHFLQIEPQLLQNLEYYSSQNLHRLYYNYSFLLSNLRDDIKKNTEVLRLIAKNFFKQFTPVILDSRPSKSTLDPSYLKIGIISPHFNRHSVGWCSADIIGELSKLTPHLHLYVTGTLKPDDRTARFQQTASKFYLPKNPGNTAEILNEIVKDDLDILIDLDSLTFNVNVEILHCKPARICLSWLGFDAPFISSDNYFLGDWYTHPQGTEGYYQEKLLRMPDSFVAISGFETHIGDRDRLRNSLGIHPEQTVYLCVAPGRKFNPDLARAQVQILQQVPNSVLLHKGQGDRASIASTYQQECQGCGVDFSRIQFLPRTQTEEEHRLVYSIADILLDSYPYNGGTHTLESLWFNLPVVTRSGEQFLSRMGYSFLQGLGLNAGVAWSWEEYIYWGIRFGNDKEFRQSIRQHLIASKQSKSLAPLWNTQKFARDMYALLQTLICAKN